MTVPLNKILSQTWLEHPISGHYNLMYVEMDNFHYFEKRSFRF